MTRVPTLSGLGLVAACPGSLRLRRTRRDSAAAAMGRATHKVCECGVTADTAEDAAAIAERHGLAPDDAGRLAFIAKHLALPVPADALCEVSLGLFPDGSVRRIEGGAGEYPDVGQILSGQLDCMWAEPEPLIERWAGGEFLDGYDCAAGSTLWVIDVKTGDEDNVPPPDRNWQLRGAAVMAARWTGAARVAVAICYVNAADCADAVRAGRPYQGRWEGAGPLEWDATEGRHVRKCVVWDAAKLTEIETELRAVLARAKGDERGSCADGSGDRGSGGTRTGGQAWVGERDGRADNVQRQDEDPAGVRIRPLGDRLVLGPHCEWCDARSACPAFAAEALNLARSAYPYTPEADGGMPLTTPEASYLAGIIPAMRRAIDSAEAAVKAHVRDHGPLRLADGRDFFPSIETVTKYATAPTFLALAEVVGDEKANEAFSASGESLRRALEGQPRGTWSRLRKELEARGATVARTREVWTRKYPALPAEVSDEVHGLDQGPGCAARRDCGSSPEGSPGDGASGGREGGDRGTAPGADAGTVRDVVRVRGILPDPSGHGGEDGNGAAGVRPVTRATCPACGASHLVTRTGLRAHFAPGTKLRCSQKGAHNGR